MLCNEKSTFNFISVVKSDDKYGLCDIATLSRDTSKKTLFVKYICHRTEKSLIFGVHFSGEGSIESLSRSLRQIFNSDLVFYTPVIIEKECFSVIGSIADYYTEIPPALCCQAICPLSDEFKGATTGSTWIILYVVEVCPNSSRLCTGHTPFVLPFLQSRKSILSYMLRMLWISMDEFQYMQTLPMCSCTTKNKVLELIPITDSRDGRVEIALLLPCLGIGEMVKASRRNCSGLIETTQGTISRRYVEMGSLVYDVGYGECWKGISPLHVLPL